MYEYVIKNIYLETCTILQTLFVLESLTRKTSPMAKWIIFSPKIMKVAGSNLVRWLESTENKRINHRIEIYVIQLIGDVKGISRILLFIWHSVTIFLHKSIYKFYMYSFDFLLLDTRTDIYLLNIYLLCFNIIDFTNVYLLWKKVLLLISNIK